MGFIITSKTASFVASQLDDISRKLNICSDNTIKSTAQELINSLNGSVSKKSQNVIDKAEHLLDCVNTANEEYCTLFNEWIPYSERGISFFDKMLMKILPEKNFMNLKRQIWSAPRAVSNRSNEVGFKNIAKFSSLKRYISKYSDDKDMINYLYEQYYLKNIDDEELVNYLKKIDKDFGIKLFTDVSLNKSSQLYIYDELMNFKKASLGKEEFPPLIDITDFDPMTNILDANGICIRTPLLEKLQFGARIAVEESYMEYYQGFRHELIHWFDKKIKVTKLSGGHVRISQKEKKEMKNAGVKNLLYAYSNDNEFKAVWGQGSMPKYSDKFKEKMIKKGIPRWITNLDDVNIATYLDDIYIDEKNKKLLDKTKQLFDGNLPDALTLQIINNPEKIDKYFNILQYKDSSNRPLFLYCLDDYCDLPKEKFDFVEKFSKLNVIDIDFPPLSRSLEDLSYKITDFSVEELENIYQKAQKCKTTDDYHKLLDEINLHKETKLNS